MNQITTVTLVRHAQADAAALDPAARPLTETGRTRAGWWNSCGRTG